MGMVFFACIIILAANFGGGILSTVLYAFESAVVVRKMSDKPSFRLFVMSEVVFVVFLLYYYTVAGGRLINTEVGFWAASIVIAPLLAVIGAQIGRFAMWSRLKEKEAAIEKLEAKEKVKAREEARLARAAKAADASQKGKDEFLKDDGLMSVDEKAKFYKDDDSLYK